jgi:hypothetical protein
MLVPVQDWGAHRAATALETRGQVQGAAPPLLWAAARPASVTRRCCFDALLLQPRCRSLLLRVATCMALVSRRVVPPNAGASTTLSTYWWNRRIRHVRRQ